MRSWLRPLALCVALFSLSSCTFIEGIAPGPTPDRYYVCENTYVCGMVSASVVEYRVDSEGHFIRVRTVR